MSAILLGKAEVESPEWWAMRANGLGGSEVAAIVGLSPWTSRFALWHRKRGTIAEQEANESMDWGTRLEPVIVAAWQELNPDARLLPGGTYQNVDRPWQIGNPDLLLEDAILEVKTADKYDAHSWGKTGTDQIPPYYACQVQWYMDCIGVQKAHVAVLIGGNDFRVYEVPYDEAQAKWLRSEAETFWATVLGNQPPALDTSESTYEAVRELNPLIDGTEIQLDPTLWDEYEKTKAAEEAAKAAHLGVKTRVLDEMGTSKYGLLFKARVVRREAKGSGKPYLKAIPQPKFSEEAA